MLDTYVALLRGVNVGGKNKLPMKDLAQLCAEANCLHVQTYIQSGNAVFQAAAGAADRLPLRIAALIAGRFGFQVPVVLRTANQLEAIVASNPFLEQNAPEEALHVMFLADLPRPEQVASLDPNRSAPDTFVVRGGDIYLHLPSGVADTKLTNAYFDAKLATISTSRNWKTITKLLELTSAMR